VKPKVAKGQCPDPSHCVLKKGHRGMHVYTTRKAGRPSRYDEGYKAAMDYLKAISAEESKQSAYLARMTRGRLDLSDYLLRQVVRDAPNLLAGTGPVLLSPEFARLRVAIRGYFRLTRSEEESHVE
jgi:hypothetical protein